MLGTKPASAGANAAYNLAAASAEMIWAWALATTHVTVASTARGLELWSHMLRTPSGLPLRGIAAAPPVVAEAPAEPPSDAALPDREVIGAATDPAPAEPGAFASYRSAGGHAAAQVTVSS